MKVYEKSVSEPIKTLLHKRLTVSDALVYGGAIHFAFADATQNKRPSATQEFMETIMAGVPVVPDAGSFHSYFRSLFGLRLMMTMSMPSWFRTGLSRRF